MLNLVTIKYAIEIEYLFYDDCALMRDKKVLLC
jgi:hypothetical protein